MRDQVQLRGAGRVSQKPAVKDRDLLEEKFHPNKIFIGGLSYKSTTQHLREHFAAYGAIVDAVVLRLPDGRSRGFGYVTFAEAAPACEALREPQVVGGREVDVKRAVPGTNKLFVGGLPHNTTASELQEYFERYGVVSDAVVMMDASSGRSRGFGFVCFLPGKDGATAVDKSFDDYQSHRIRGKWIEIKNAAPPHKVFGANGMAAACDGSSTALSDDADSSSTASSVSGSCRSGNAAVYSETARSVKKSSCTMRPANHISQSVDLLGEPKKVTLGGSGAFPKLDSPLKISPTMTAPPSWAGTTWPAGTGHAPWPDVPWSAGTWPTGPLPSHNACPWLVPWPCPAPAPVYSQWPGAAAVGVNSGETVHLLGKLLQQSSARPVGCQTQFQI